MDVNGSNLIPYHLLRTLLSPLEDCYSHFSPSMSYLFLKLLLLPWSLDHGCSHLQRCTVWPSFYSYAFWHLLHPWGIQSHGYSLCYWPHHLLLQMKPYKIAPNPFHIDCHAYCKRSIFVTSLVVLGQLLHFNCPNFC